MNAEVDIHQEKIEAVIQSILSKLEENIKHRMEDNLSYVDQKMQGLCKGLTKKIDETQVDLQAIKTFLDTWMKSLQEP
jgi:F0F1-type ATP synthase membrane subunit b/b'